MNRNSGMTDGSRLCTHTGASVTAAYRRNPGSGAEAVAEQLSLHELLTAQPKLEAPQFRRPDAAMMHVLHNDNRRSGIHFEGKRQYDDRQRAWTKGGRRRRGKTFSMKTSLCRTSAKGCSLPTAVIGSTMHSSSTSTCTSQAWTRGAHRMGRTRIGTVAVRDNGKARRLSATRDQVHTASGARTVSGGGMP